MAIATERDGRIQVVQHEETLCLVDGAPLSTKEPSEDPSKSCADAIAREWRERGTPLLREKEITASLVLCDAASNQLVLARAQNGVPPIFFAETQDTLLWSNSIKTLLRHGVEAVLDHALDAYFALGYVPSPWTLFTSVCKVPAGQYLEWAQGSWSFRRHQAPIPQSRTVHDLDARTVELKRRLCQGLHQIVDGYDKVGVLLSSGVDSSLLVGLLHCELGVQVEAFTFDYSDYDGKYNEYDQARRLTRRYNIPHHKIEYNGKWLRVNLKDAVRQYEEPFTYGSHTARLGPVKRKGIPLLLSGVTGELFISRTASYALRIDNSTLKSAAALLRDPLDMWGPSGPSRFKHFVDITTSPAEKIFYKDVSVNRILSDSIRQRLYQNDALYEAGYNSILSLFRNCLDEAGLNRKIDKLSHLKRSFILPDHILFWNYRWAHEHGLEMRAPYTVPDVGHWMESLRQPLWPAYQEPVQKVLIRRAATTVMPDELAYNRKIAQSAPFWVWFQGPLRPLLQKYLSPSALREDGLFEVEFVQREVQEHITGTGRRPYLIWSLLCFMIWKRVFLESGDFT